MAGFNLNNNLNITTVTESNICSIFPVLPSLVWVQTINYECPMAPLNGHPMSMVENQHEAIPEIDWSQWVSRQCAGRTPCNSWLFFWFFSLRFSLGLQSFRFSAKKTGQRVFKTRVVRHGPLTKSQNRAKIARNEFGQNGCAWHMIGFWYMSGRPGPESDIKIWYWSGVWSLQAAINMSF